jgi:hypothetical protein
MILYAFKYEKPFSTSPTRSGLLYDRLREDVLGDVQRRGDLFAG